MIDPKNNIFQDHFQENNIDKAKKIILKKDEKNLFYYAKIHLIEREEKTKHNLNKDQSHHKSTKILSTLNNIQILKQPSNVTPWEKLRFSLSRERNQRRDKIEGIKTKKVKLDIQGIEKRLDLNNNNFLSEYTKINSPKIIHTNINIVSLQNNQLNIKKIKLNKHSDKTKNSSYIPMKSFTQTDANKEDLSSNVFTVTHLSTSYVNCNKKDEGDIRKKRNINKSLPRLMNEGSKSLVKYMKIKKIPL